jgi:hypothetical protein
VVENNVIYRPFVQLYGAYSLCCCIWQLAGANCHSKGEHKNDKAWASIIFSLNLTCKRKLILKNVGAKNKSLKELIKALSKINDPTNSSINDI